jgi:hypothetical protein
MNFLILNSSPASDSVQKIEKNDQSNSNTMNF